jgi:hypothetical protein
MMTTGSFVDRVSLGSAEGEHDDAIVMSPFFP